MDGDVGSAPTTYLYAYVGQTPTPLLHPRQRGIARVCLRNVGSAIWTRADPHPILLGTDRPQDRRSPFFETGSWPRPNRPARLIEPIVRPGEIGTFEIVLRAPARPGRYREWLRPVADGLIWFNDLDLFLDIDVVLPSRDDSDFSAHLVAPMAPLLLPPGGTGCAVVRLRNTGRIRWTDRGGDYGPLVQLATDAPADHDSPFFVPDHWIAPTRPVRVPGFVLPGQEVDLSFPVRAPATRGDHVEHYRLVAENLRAIGLPGLAMLIRVV